MKYIYLFCIVLFFQGCVFTANTINKTNYKSTPVQKPQKIMPTQKDSSSLYDIEIQTVKKPQKINFFKTFYTGSIKGVIKSLTYDKKKKSWLYEIVGKDTSHGKLPYAKFYNDKKLANRGDFVYVILNNSVLKDIFFIKKANKNYKKLQKTKISKKYLKLHKQNKSRKSPDISLPTVENVTF
ncbi:MAG: hypothetical protein QM482_00550 [Sulfurospirillum sp.]